MPGRSAHGGARTGAGRKPLGPVTMVRLSVMLPPELAAWVKSQPEGASACVRDLVEREWQLDRDGGGYPDQPFT